MKCTKCGKENDNSSTFCGSCGSSLFSDTQNNTPKSTSDDRCLPSFILGLIGSIFGILGGICTTMCSAFDSNGAFIMIVGGSTIGLIGACQCLKRAKIGSVLELVGVVMIIMRAFTAGAEFITVIGMIFLALAALIGLGHTFLSKRK